MLRGHTQSRKGPQGPSLAYAPAVWKRGSPARDQDPSPVSPQFLCPRLTTRLPGYLSLHCGRLGQPSRGNRDLPCGMFWELNLQTKLST